MSIPKVEFSIMLYNILVNMFLWLQRTKHRDFNAVANRKLQTLPYAAYFMFI